MSLLLILCSCTISERAADARSAADTPHSGRSTFFSTAYIQQTGYDTPSDGDLWPAAWSDDGVLYAANGDGEGFGEDFGDIVFNKITGHPETKNISGETIAIEMGPVWGDTSKYNRKPTGLVSVDGVLYLAVQDLNKTRSRNIFNEAPAATIIRSEDKGKTWQWDEEGPMFDDYLFTTVIFLDYGQDAKNHSDEKYVYAYGMDNNWRDSFSDVVPDPTQLYLARVPKEAIQNVKKWQFYTGDLDGNASWSQPGETNARRPVLKDKRRRYKDTFPFKGIDSLSVVSQGSIVYNKPLDRYIYTSWTEYTFEFYEAPAPWGPWKLFLSKDFGSYPWDDQNFGGYATVIPSKFISEDGTEMWVSSSTFAGGVHHYNFSLRKLMVTPYKATEPENAPGLKNLASGNLKEVVPISAKAIRHGDLQTLNDTNKQQYIDSYSTEKRTNDYWGYTWPEACNLNKIVYTTGAIEPGQGGWFRNIEIQVRQEFQWIPVNNIRVDAAYTYDKNVEPYHAYTITFDPAWGDGIRLSGKPGGRSEYTSIAELEVYYQTE